MLHPVQGDGFLSLHQRGNCSSERECLLMVDARHERDGKIIEARRRAEDDRNEVEKVGKELVSLYEDENELLKNARVVGLDEIEENEFNLNIPHYIDTFEPEPMLDVADALRALIDAQAKALVAQNALLTLLGKTGYVTD
jgi:type I restriction enzyme M protein